MSIPHATYVPRASPTYSFLSSKLQKKKSHADNVTFLASIKKTFALTKVLKWRTQTDS